MSTDIDNESTSEDRGVVPVNAPPEQMLGTIFVGRYELMSIIGAGGMGVIFLARQVFLDRIVAIKLLKNNLASVQAKMRFHQEAKAASALNHPGIVSIGDFGVDQFERPYMVMEHVQGGTFADLLRERHVLSFSELLPIFLEICDALSEAHHKGVIHRDLKPTNIMLVTTSDGGAHIKLLDFGIAKMQDLQENTLQDLTKTGEALGTPLYMSPEQINSKKVTARSDLYSLGCMLYACLTGTPPFVGQNKLDTMEKHCTEAPQPLAVAAPDVTFPAGLEPLVMCLLEKNPDDRFVSVDDFKNALIDLAAQYKLMPRLNLQALSPGKLYLTGAIPKMAATVVDAIPVAGSVIESDLAPQSDKTRTAKVDERSATSSSVAPPVVAPGQKPLRLNKRVLTASIILFVLLGVAAAGFYVVQNRRAEIQEENNQLQVGSTTNGQVFTSNSKNGQLVLNRGDLSSADINAEVQAMIARNSSGDFLMNKVDLFDEATWKALEKAKITTLTCNDDSIGAASILPIGRLQGPTTLVLDPCTKLTDVDIGRLAGGSISRLAVQKSHLSNKLGKIIAGMPQITSLSVFQNRQLGDDFLAGLFAAPESNKAIGHLNVASCGIDNGAASSLLAAPNLSELDISYNRRVDDTLVRALQGRASQYKVLYLAGLELHGCRNHLLKPFDNLVALDLSGVELSDEAIDDLCRMPHLCLLVVYNCNLKPAQLKRLGDVLMPRNGHLVQTQNPTMPFKVHDFVLWAAKQ